MKGIKVVAEPISVLLLDRLGMLFRDDLPEDVLSDIKIQLIQEFTLLESERISQCCKKAANIEGDYKVEFHTFERSFAEVIDNALNQLL